MTFFKHEFKMNIKSLLIWSTSVGGMAFIMLLIFPTMKGELDNMTDMYANLGALSMMFNMETLQMGNIMGFYGIEAGVMLSLGGSMFAAVLGTGILAKEEAYHTTEYIYVTPNSRKYFITQKLFATGSLIVAFNILCLLWSLFGIAIIGENVEWDKLLLFHLAQLIMHLQIGAICFVISSYIRKLNIGIGIGISLILYFLHLLGNASKSVEHIHFITPFYYSDADTVFKETSIPLEYLSIGLVITIACIVVAYVKYSKKDLSV